MYSNYTNIEYSYMLRYLINNIIFFNKNIWKVKSFFTIVSHLNKDSDKIRFESDDVLCLEIMNIINILNRWLIESR